MGKSHSEPELLEIPQCKKWLTLCQLQSNNIVCDTDRNLVVQCFRLSLWMCFIGHGGFVDTFFSSPTWPWLSWQQCSVNTSCLLTNWYVTPRGFTEVPYESKTYITFQRHSFQKVGYRTVPMSKLFVYWKCWCHPCVPRAGSLILCIMSFLSCLLCAVIGNQAAK